MEFPPARSLGETTLPGYQRVRQWLLEYISREQLEPGDRIPSERILADALGLSRPTIAKAVAELVDEGTLMRALRSGTFVGGRVRGRKSSGLRTIGIMMPWLTEDGRGQVTARVMHDKVHLPHRDSMHLDVLQGAMSVLNSHGCAFLVLPNNSAREGAEILAKLADDQLDGVLAMPTDSYAHEQLYSNAIEAGKPIVFIDRYCPNLKADRVVTDNVNGARMAVRYLIGKGHRRIAMFTDFSTMTSVQDRQKGYKAALEEAGIRFDDDLLCGPQIARFGWWRLDFALEHCRSLPDPITAVFCMNDTSLMATIEAADRLGIRVPDEIELISFFDDHVSSEISTPFSRIKQDTQEMGRIGAEMLMERISGTAPDEPRHVLVTARLIPAE